MRLKDMAGGARPGGPRPSAIVLPTSLHLLSLLALLYIIVLVRSAAQKCSRGEDVGPMVQAVGAAGAGERDGQGSASALVEGNLPLGIGGAADSDLANLATQGQTAAATPLECANYEQSERIYQENLKKRQSFYGSEPLRKAELLQSKYAKPSAIKSAFVLELYTPNYPCFPEERIGHWSDGGKWLCRLGKLNSSSVVYSIGSNGVDTYEVELHRRTGSQIHVFDHTLNRRKMALIEGRTEYTFHKQGLGVSTERSKRISSLPDLMKSLGHAFIDVFKIDCESCEYDVLPAILEKLPKPFGQIQVEVHGIDRRERLGKFLSLLEAKGYRLFHQEMNWRAMNHMELAFIHEDLCKC